ncbi:MAG TPA: hypothetical protein ENJ82_05435 [Bacteroidetes bacterium]|nr:hypothetical protein [Bacteroidota bacterium]
MTTKTLFLALVTSLVFHQIASAAVSKTDKTALNSVYALNSIRTNGFLSRKARHESKMLVVAQETTTYILTDVPNSTDFNNKDLANKAGKAFEQADRSCEIALADTAPGPIAELEFTLSNVSALNGKNWPK